MLNYFLSNANYPAIVVSGLVYWLLGALWFSVLFGKIWGAELEKHGVKIKQPTSREMMLKFVQTFLLNVVVALGVELIVIMGNIGSVVSALKIGLFLGICLSAATFGIAHTWEGRSLKLFAIDCGYPVLGITACNMILTLWR